MRALFAFLTLFAVSAFGGQQVDTASVTCEDYNTSAKEEMTLIEAALHDALKSDADLGNLSQSAFSDTVYGACSAYPDATVIEALLRYNRSNVVDGGT